MLGSPLTTVTMDRAEHRRRLSRADPRRRGAGARHLVRRALLRLAAAVHEQGYKVALTGEGADEALAGYVWFKTQTIRDAVIGRIGPCCPDAAPPAPPGADRRRPAAPCPPSWPIGGRPARPAGPLRADRPGRADRSTPRAMWERLGDHDPYADLDITNDRIAPLASAEPVALRRLQGDARRAC